MLFSYGGKREQSYLPSKMPSLPRTVESVFIPNKMVAHYFSGIIAVQFFFFFKFKAIYKGQSNIGSKFSSNCSEMRKSLKKILVEVLL